MHAHVSGKHGSSKRCLAAAGAVVCLSVTVAACGSTGGSSKGDSAASLSPTQAVLLAANSAEKVNTFSGTISIQGAVDDGSVSGPVDIAGTVSGQLHPSLLLSENMSTFSSVGENLAPMDEVITPQDLYLKMGVLTQMLHTGKPWIEMPLSAISAKSGINFSSLISQAQNSSPLTEVQLLAGAGDVKEVGTGTVGGVPVTEYSGTTAIAKAINAMPADSRAGIEKALAPAGIKTASFKVWLDSGHQARKAIITEHGTTVSETMTVTLTSMNKPVTIAAPPTSQVTSLPASALGGL